MNVKEQHRCLAILDATIGETPVKWAAIRDAVSQQMTIANWLDVRGVLQWAINDGRFERVRDVHVEAYQRV
ncbi:hypothetical protein WL99_20090 [Burkholderia cepacia]|uniref:hypothetical protein n=1 Tax=Burkholderia cepacia TaxID=292 RepID=UPI0007530D51|nr:hypothetical protein [Burkholderia cepacia]KWH27656.1 hypothetical protein WL99_20090 [Burkholderia cepacia]